MGPVAQWSEQGTHNPLVVGSIPTRPTMKTESEQQPYIKQMPKGECTYCDLQYDKPNGFFPPHTASPRCQSGGYNHCTCDTCF